MRKHNGYWNEENIISKLKMVIKKLGHFPTRTELNNLNECGLTTAIARNGGFIYFREKLGYKLIRKPNGYWNIDNTIKEIYLVIEEICHFPNSIELINIGKCDLAYSILKNGGYNYFREKLEYEIIKKSKGFWNDTNIINELKLIIEIINHFPTEFELRNLNKRSLAGGIYRNGGISKFQKILGYESKHKPEGYWTDENTISELEPIIKELGHFPSATELTKMKRDDLINVITTNGGTIYFRKKCGFSSSIQEIYKFKLNVYINKRGRKTEQFIKEIIIEWSNINNKPLPDLNVKLAKGNVLEFVCDLDKKVGIDVTNTKASKYSAIRTISRKWTKKNYRLYLDELWIVVFTDVLSSNDYDKLNIKSPENVKIFSAYGFLKELDYSIKHHDKDKINKLNNCTFHNKDKMIGINKSVRELYI